MDASTRQNRRPERTAVPVRTTSRRMERLIVVGPLSAADRLRGRFGDRYEILHFRSSEQLERWCDRMRQTALREEVQLALASLGCNPAELPGCIRAVIERLATMSAVPPMRTLVHGCASLRSFYRLWSESVPERPAYFLLRVRLLRAQRLLAEGEAWSCVAERSGFASGPQLRKRMIEFGLRAN